MKKGYKNEIFLFLSTHQMGIDNYDFIDKEDRFSVVFRPFGGLFRYDFISDSQSFDHFQSAATSYSPGYKSKFRASVALPFGQVFTDFVIWIESDINEYIKEKEQPDRWAEYKKLTNASVIKAEDFTDISDFLPGEKEQIKIALKELKLLIIERFAENKEQIENVNLRMTYLEQAIDRTNKTDWKGLFLNTIISITIALSLDTQRGKELIDLFVQLMQIAPGLNY